MRDVNEQQLGAWITGEANKRGASPASRPPNVTRTAPRGDVLPRPGTLDAHSAFASVQRCSTTLLTLKPSASNQRALRAISVGELV